jgi:hypothetical protein
MPCAVFSPLSCTRGKNWISFKIDITELSSGVLRRSVAKRTSTLSVAMKKSPLVAKWRSPLVAR